VTVQSVGEGQYGKVYSAVNVDTGELMAMKELRFQPNDLQTIKEIADELKIFESIQHPSLVKYYGVEVHRVSSVMDDTLCSNFVGARAFIRVCACWHDVPI